MASWPLMSTLLLSMSAIDALMSTSLPSMSAFDASWALMPMQLQMSALLATMLDDAAPIAFGLLHLDVVVRGMLLEIYPG